MSYIGNKPADTIATSADISDGAITAAKLATSSVTQPKINGGVAGTGPAFGVYQSSNQSLTTATFTKMQLNTEEFDTASAFDNATNYRFTPQVAGYYQINAAVTMSGTGVTRFFCSIYKNGSEYKRGNDLVGTGYETGVSSVLYLNGSTDYVELYAYIQGASSLVTSASSREVYMNGFLARAT